MIARAPTRCGSRSVIHGGLRGDDQRVLAPGGWMVEHGPRQDMLAFQIDLWNAHGEVPSDLAGVATRQKEIQYSSRNPREHGPALRSCDFIGEAPRRAERQQRGDAASLRRRPQGLQPRPSDLSLQALREQLQRLRVFPPRHAGALAERLLRRVRALRHQGMLEWPKNLEGVCVWV
jgi:hypothetical protein